MTCDDNVVGMTGWRTNPTNERIHDVCRGAL